MKKKFIEVKQGKKLTMYMVSMTIDELINNTEVSIYDPIKETGYQRSPIKGHYLKITKYLKIEEEPVLPPQILVALEKENIIKERNKINLNGKMRLVDGQHRVEALKVLKEKHPERYKELADMEFPVTIISVKERDSYLESETFYNVNKLGKTVETNLALNLMNKIKEKQGKDLSVKEKCVVVVNKLKNNKTSFWYGKIRGGNEPRLGRTVSLNLFSNSIRKIMEEFSDTEINKIVETLEGAWRIIEKKWLKACKNPKEFNILKGIGVSPLHIVLKESLVIKNNKVNIKSTLKNFEIVINSSQVTDEYWRIGGVLSSFNSSSGFKNIAKIIKNEEEAD